MSKYGLLSTYNHNEIIRHLTHLTLQSLLNQWIIAGHGIVDLEMLGVKKSFATLDQSRQQELFILFLASFILKVYHFKHFYRLLKICCDKS
jgi:hypothetical protein